VVIASISLAECVLKKPNDPVIRQEARIDVRCMYGILSGFSS